MNKEIKRETIFFFSNLSPFFYTCLFFSQMHFLLSKSIPPLFLSFFSFSLLTFYSFIFESFMMQPFIFNFQGILFNIKVKIFCCLQWLVNMRLDACSKRKFKIRVLILPYLSLVITQNSFFLPNSNIPLSVFNSTYTITNSNITWEFSCKFVKKICKKRPFPAIFSKNFNWQVIPS